MTRQEAAQELLRRRGGRSCFHDYCKDVYPNYDDGPHLELLCNKLEAVERGEIKRLIVTMPPRHSKSVHVSQLFPNWVLGRNPDWAFLQTGFGSSISQFHSKYARKFHDGVEHREFFPNDNNAQRQALNEWFTKEGGLYRACGLLGGITGRGYQIISIDDPHKNRQEANSPTYRQRVIDGFRSDIIDRLTQVRDFHGAIILTMTRWHKADLVGFILDEMEQGGTQWDVVSLPAIAGENDLLEREPGEALYPARFPLWKLDEIRKGIGSAEWWAKFMCDPRDPEGGMFQREWFLPVVDKAPENLVDITRAWDLAAGDDKKSDATAGILCGRDPNTNIFYVLDLVHFRKTALNKERAMRATAQLDGPGVTGWIEQEGGSGGKDYVGYLLRDVLTGYPYYRQKPKGSKPIRANPVAAAAEDGRVKIVRASWNNLYLDQHDSFMNGGAHDDIIDAESLCFSKVMLPSKNEGSSGW